MEVYACQDGGKCTMSLMPQKDIRLQLWFNRHSFYKEVTYLFKKNSSNCLHPWDSYYQYRTKILQYIPSLHQINTQGIWDSKRDKH